MRVLWNVPLLALTFLIFSPVAAPLAGQAAPDTARLRQALATAFGDDFVIARTELGSGLTERGGTFWLVHARPRRSGDYELRYRYDYRDRVRPNGPLYTHVEHTSYIRVGERGCWRRQPGKEMCVGDTIILPFVFDEHTGHVFTVGRRASSAESGAGERAAPAVELAAAVDSVPNPLSAHLIYVGSSSYEMLKRSGGGSIVTSAQFQAVAPGRFNLSLDGSARGSIPVVIVPRGQPVTVLLADETVEGTDQLRGFSSHSGNQYLTTALILQPGDRITLQYAHHEISRDQELAANSAARRRTEAAPPVITRLPFHLDVTERFNAWLAPHLPPGDPQP